MQQQLQPDSVWALNKNLKQAVQRLVQLRHMTLLKAVAAFVLFGFASWDVRGRRRKRKLDDETLWPKECVLLRHTEQDDTDAEPKDGKWWMSVPGNDVRRTTNDLSGVPLAASVRNINHHRCPHVPEKLLMPQHLFVHAKTHPVVSNDDEEENEDRVEVGSFQMFRMSTEEYPQVPSAVKSLMPQHLAVHAKTHPVASTHDEQEDEDCVEVGRVQMFRMNTVELSQVPLEQVSRESQVGLRSSTLKLEHKIRQNASMHRRVTFS